MNDTIPGTLLLDPAVLEDPYPFYALLRREAPVWRVPGTDVFVVSSFGLASEYQIEPPDAQRRFMPSEEKRSRTSPPRCSFTA